MLAFWKLMRPCDHRDAGGGGGTATVTDKERLEAGEREAEKREKEKAEKAAALVRSIAKEVAGEIVAALRGPERPDALRAALADAGGDVRRLAYQTAEDQASQLQSWERAVEKLAKETNGWSPAYRYANVYQAAERRKVSGIRGTISDRLYAGDPEPAIRAIKYFRALLAQDMREAAKYGARALGESTLSAGGALVPEEFAQDVIAKMGDLTPLATKEFVRVMPMKSDTLRVPYLKTLPVAVYGTESTEPTGTTDPAWGSVELIAREALMIVPVSEQQLDDASVEMIGYMTDLFAEALARLRNLKMLLGSGSSEPEGVITNSAVGTNTYDTTNSGTKFRSVLRCYHAVKAAYRAGAIWVMSDIAQETLSGVLDSNNQPIMTQLMDEPFMRLRGKPVYITEAIGTATPTKAVFGNWKFYLFGDRMTMQAKTDNGGDSFRKREVQVRVIERYDGKIAQAEAFNVMTGIQ